MGGKRAQNWEKVSPFLRILWVFGFLGGCGQPSLQTHPLPHLYPTQRVFHAPEAKVQKAIQKMCRNPQAIFQNPADHPPLLELIWKGEAAARGVSIFNHMVDRDDAYLSCEGEPVCKSKVYTDRRGKPLEYLADFQVHILPQGTRETYVRVMALHPRVIAGKRFGFGSGGFGARRVYEDVQPTTVEEGEILSAIKKYLNR